MRRVAACGLAALLLVQPARGEDAVCAPSEAQARTTTYESEDRVTSRVRDLIALLREREGNLQVHRSRGREEPYLQLVFEGPKPCERGAPDECFTFHAQYTPQQVYIHERFAADGKLLDVNIDIPTEALSYADQYLQERIFPGQPYEGTEATQRLILGAMGKHLEEFDLFLRFAGKQRDSGHNTFKRADEPDAHGGESVQGSERTRVRP